MPATLAKHRRHLHVLLTGTSTPLATMFHHHPRPTPHPLHAQQPPPPPPRLPSSSLPLPLPSSPFSFPTRLLSPPSAASLARPCRLLHFLLLALLDSPSPLSLSLACLATQHHHLLSAAAVRQPIEHHRHPHHQPPSRPHLPYPSSPLPNRTPHTASFFPGQPQPSPSLATGHGHRLVAALATSNHSPMPTSLVGQQSLP